eukprot:3239810-Lingulodinium_polyedra.AAC.1
MAKSAANPAGARPMACALSTDSERLAWSSWANVRRVLWRNVRPTFAPGLPSRRSRDACRALKASQQQSYTA